VTQLFKQRDAKREAQMIAKAKLAQKALMEILDSRGYKWGEIDVPDDFLI
jgi:hypothetical protein